jgi:hypothetical protein
MIQGRFFIQMLCEDYEVFLEMAQVLKGLKVSILKGVLEHRSDKLWARFVIEVHQRFSPFCSKKKKFPLPFVSFPTL